MNDYEGQLLAGMPELTEEQRQRLLLEQQQVQSQIEQLGTQQVAQPQVSQPSATVGGQAAPPVQQQTSPFRTKTGDIDLDKLRKQGNELDLMVPVGLLDFGADLLNMIPKVNLPKVPKFENDIAQSVRELSSIVIPTLTLGGIGGAALKGAAKGSKFLSDPLVRKIGEIGFAAGTGAFVDYTVKINQEDDNLAGSLRKNWPRWFGWIPGDVATLDTDSPEVKRGKNVTEGVYLGVGADVLLGLNKLFKGVRGIDRSTQWIPETEKAKKWFSNNLEPEGTVEDVVEASAAKRSASLDEIGNYNVSKRIVDTEVPITGRDYYINTMTSRAQDIPPEEAMRVYSEAWDSMDELGMKVCLLR